MVMSQRAYAAERADEKRSEAARRGAVTRENRAKRLRAWERAHEREHGRLPSPAELRDAIARIKREVVR